MTMRWHLKELIGRAESVTGTSISYRDIYAATGISMLLAVCSTARVSNGCGESSAKTRYPSSSAARTADEKRTVCRKLSAQ